MCLLYPSADLWPTYANVIELLCLRKRAGATSCLHAASGVKGSTRADRCSPIRDFWHLRLSCARFFGLQMIGTAQLQNKQPSLRLNSRSTCFVFGRLTQSEVTVLSRASFYALIKRAITDLPQVVLARSCMRQLHKNSRGFLQLSCAANNYIFMSQGCKPQCTYCSLLLKPAACYHDGDVAVKERMTSGLTKPEELGVLQFHNCTGIKEPEELRRAAS